MGDTAGMGGLEGKGDSGYMGGSVGMGRNPVFDV